jgi:DNA-cytosine methyltransferase
MNVLSLFDGMSCGRIALDRVGIPVEKYYASEIDKHAMKVAKANWPEIIHVGDVRRSWEWESRLPKIDLLIGGSPCQGFSMAGKRLNFNDKRSALFFKYLGILRRLREKNPEIKFLLENVLMDRESEGVITTLLGAMPILINSSLVSAQNRERLYWTNIGPGYFDLVGTRVSEISQPKDRGILLKDIIEDGAVDREKSYCIDANYFKGDAENYLNKSRRQIVLKNSETLTQVETA